MKGVKYQNLAIVDIKKKTSKGAEILYITRAKKADRYILDIDLSNCVLIERTKRNTYIQETYIRHPFKSKYLRINYDHSPFLDSAQKVWEEDALERIHPTATVLIADEKIIGKAGNGLTYHTVEMCERKKLNYPTGQGYHLCNGNHLPENHSEPKAIRNAVSLGNGSQLYKATAYLYGHWWSCIDCSNAMEKAGIKKLVISKVWTKMFLGL